MKDLPNEIMAVLANNEAEKSRQIGENEKAQQYFIYALQLVEQGGVTPRTEASICCNFGLFLRSQGQTKLSTIFHHRALDIDLKSNAAPVDIAFSYHNLGFSLVHDNDPKEGIKYLLKAQEIRESINQYDELLATYEALGEAYLTTKELTKAESTAKKGLVLQSKLGNHPSFRGIFGVLAKTAKQNGQLDKAAYYHIQIVILLENLRSSNNQLERLDKFDARYNLRYIDAIESLLDSENFSGALSLIDRTRFRSGCDALDQPQVLGSPLEKDSLIIPKVKKNELYLIEWIYPKFDWSFSLSSTSQKIVANRIITSTREGAPKKLELKTEWPIHFNNILSQTQQVINAYSDKLNHIDTIIFIPHGTQWQTPFAALKNPNSGKYLLDTHSLLISPSLRYCKITEDETYVKSSQNLVVYADPKGNLKNARKEAKLVSNLLGCNLIEGSAAKKKEIIKLLSNNTYNIIHFSCHGLYSPNGVHSLFLNDDALTSDEFGKLNFKANLVNLASCWSGMTSFSVWNELHGFVRASLVRNVKNVIGSIYPLGDAAALGFNENFYKFYLKENLSAVHAYQKSIQQISHLFHIQSWGGIFITGQMLLERGGIAAPRNLKSKLLDFLRKR